MVFSLKGKKVVVTGGCGFLGQHLVESLLEAGASVTIFDIRKTYSNDKVEFVIGDINNAESLKAALKDAAVVFHCASPPPELDDRTLFYNVNVKGTKNLLQACRDNGVKKFVLTSSCSVVYEGKDIQNADEKQPYAKKPIDVYTETKILQEEEVIKANSDNLLTVAIRPHSIFGPKDILVSSMLKQAKKGLKFRIGNGKNIVDFTHVRNVAQGHIMAAERLEAGSGVAGQIFNITNDEPLGFWEFYDKLAIGLGFPTPSISIPYQLALVLSIIVNFFLVLLRPVVHIKTTFIPSRIALAGTHHSYSCEKAKKILGYKPKISLEDGIKDSLEHYAYLKTGSKKTD